jgi:hypothetical protein
VGGRDSPESSIFLSLPFSKIIVVKLIKLIFYSSKNSIQGMKSGPALVAHICNSSYLGG